MIGCFKREDRRRRKEGMERNEEVRECTLLYRRKSQKEVIPYGRRREKHGIANEAHCMCVTAVLSLTIKKRQRSKKADKDAAATWASSLK